MAVQITQKDMSAQTKDAEAAGERLGAGRLGSQGASGDLWHDRQTLRDWMHRHKDEGYISAHGVDVTLLVRQHAKRKTSSTQSRHSQKSLDLRTLYGCLAFLAKHKGVQACRLGTTGSRCSQLEVPFHAHRWRQRYRSFLVCQGGISLHDWQFSCTPPVKGIFWAIPKRLGSIPLLLMSYLKLFCSCSGPSWYSRRGSAA